MGLDLFMTYSCFLACTTCLATEYETRACAGTDNRECTSKFKMHHKIQPQKTSEKLNVY